MNKLVTLAFSSLWLLARAQQPNVTPPPTKRSEPLTNSKREFTVQQHYLNLPIKNGAPKRKMTILVSDQPFEVAEVELADANPDWWAFLDVSAWRGQTVTLIVDRLPAGSMALSLAEQSDTLKSDQPLYREPLRAQFHFSSRRGWNNDPNGLVFYRGEYHVFYQHNPYGWTSGNLHWGHAVSRDLVHWRELGEALAPDSLGAMWSGSAVVDDRNTSGLGKRGGAPLVLIYTAAGDTFGQCLAASNDGLNFKKFSGNPVVRQITHGNRDPRVFWHEPTKQWVMCLYVELNKVHTIHFLSSTDLKEWTVLSHTDGFFECPDFFELPLADGPPSWVLTAASSEYMVGLFDGTKFTSETPKLPGHRGRGFYAAQTFNGIPAHDGRRIQLGWLQTETPGMSFNQALSLPLELNLIRTPDGPRLTWTPAKELASLRGFSHMFGPLTLEPGAANPLEGLRATLVELRAEFEPVTAETIFTVRGARIAYDASKQELVVNGHRAPAPLRDGKQRLTVYCDRTALEIFASDGLTYVPMPFVPRPDDLELRVDTRGGDTKFSRMNVYELNSSWGGE
jgi:sucrose-6-phosphate hydrolase SacC (GH32 family)